MAEHTLVSGAPITSEQKISAKKTAAANPSAKGGNKQKKLYVHLLVGLMMTLVVIAGYIFFGSASQVRAAETAANQVVNTAINQTIQITAVPPAYGQVNDMATLQAEMDAIIQQIEALQTSSTSVIGSEGIGYNSPSVNQMNQMTTQMNQLVGSMNGAYPQTTILDRPIVGGGHGH